MSRACLFALLISLLTLSCSNSDSASEDGDEFNHRFSPGETAEAFLTDDEFATLIVEIDYVEGYEPTAESLQNLELFLEERLHKPGGILLELDDEIPATNNASIDEVTIADLEAEYRETYSEGNQLAAHLLVLDGRYQQENVLGLAYWNTSFVIFGEVIAENSGSFGQPSRTTVESTVLAHEAGHLLGLVDNGSPAIADHVDEENGAHCTNDSCLMYFAIQNAGFMSNLTGGNIPTLDANCIQDLQANGGK